MHDRVLDIASFYDQEAKNYAKMAETECSFPSSVQNILVSAAAATQIHCECLDELAACAAAPLNLSEPNACEKSLAWFDATVRRARIDEAFAVLDLVERAELVRKYRIVATCTCTRVLIESVHNASVTGLLVQSHLEGTVQALPRILEKLVQQNQRKIAAAQPRKRKPVRTRRRPFFLDMLSGRTPGADAEKA